jgi:regulatory protein YycI of two-component signal transduction system YycFG
MRYIEKKRNYRIGMLVFIFAVLVFHVFLGAQYLKVDKKEHLGYENEIAKLNSELKKNS